MKKRISDQHLKYLKEQSDMGCSINGDIDEVDAVNDLYEARKEIRKLQKEKKAVTP